MRKAISTFVLVGVFLYAGIAGAEMTSTNYQIRWDSLTTGGSDTASSATYGLRDSVGSLSPGSSASTNYQVSNGYRAGVFDQILTFSLFTQDSMNLPSVSSRSGLTIFVTSTSGVDIGDYIALVQDVGTNQISAIGKVVSVSTNTSITVDSWSDNGTSPTIDGINDAYAHLSGTSANLGALSGSVSTNIIGMEVNSELTNGYSIQVMASGDFTSGSTIITAVSDGSVTAGSTEYGAISSDPSLTTSTFDTQDTAFTTSFQDIVTQTGIKFSDRHFLTLKAAKSSSLEDGTFTQTLSIIASGNF